MYVGTRVAASFAVLQAIAWEAERSAFSSRDLRERMVERLEHADKRMRSSGLTRKWLGAADDITLAVSGDCNGHLFEQLLVASEYKASDSVNLLRTG